MRKLIESVSDLGASLKKMAKFGTLIDGTRCTNQMATDELGNCEVLVEERNYEVGKWRTRAEQAGYFIEEF